MTTTETRAGGGLRGLLWLTWRQHRWFVLGSLAATLAVVGVVLWFVLGLDHLASVMEATRCDQGSMQQPCAFDVAADRDFYNKYVDFPMWFVPGAFAGVVAAFVGAPLVAREYDQQTPPLIWSQSVTPVRWLVAKAGLLAAMTGVIAIALGALASLLSSAHRRIPEFVQVHSQWEAPYFDASAPVVLGHIALGIAAGALFRSTVPAMAITLVVIRRNPAGCLEGQGVLPAATPARAAAFGGGAHQAAARLGAHSPTPSTPVSSTPREPSSAGWRSALRQGTGTHASPSCARMARPISCTSGSPPTGCRRSS